MTQRPVRKDWWTMLAFLCASLALRVPFRSALPYHWDAAEFAVAVTDYDVRLSQPHAPGYFLYVMLGRLVNLFLGDPHASLVWVSVVAGSLLVPVVYWLGTTMFGRRTGIIAALLAATSPQTWFHSAVALTYIVDSLLVCLVMLTCWRAMRSGGTWGEAMLIGALLAVVGGVRQQSVLALGVVTLYTFWRFQRQRYAKLAAACVVALGLGLAWFVPMVQLSGGLPVYLKIVRLHAAFNRPATLLGGGLDALVWNIAFVGLFCANGLMLGVIVLFVALLYRARWMDPERRRQWNRDHASALRLLAIWIGSMLLLATVIGFTKQPGYVLSFLPALLLLAAVALAGHPKLAAVVCAFNIFAFVGWPAAWDGVFFDVGRTARLLREHQRRTTETVATIRNRYSPADTVICHATDLYFGLRQFQLLLPEFDQYQLPPDPTMLTPRDKPLIAVRQGKLTFVAPGDWDGKRRSLLLVPPGRTLGLFMSYLDVSKAERVSETIYRIQSAKRVGLEQASFR
jgi:hypothetical protein